MGEFRQRVLTETMFPPNTIEMTIQSTNVSPHGFAVMCANCVQCPMELNDPCCFGGRRFQQENINLARPAPSHSPQLPEASNDLPFFFTVTDFTSPPGRTCIPVTCKKHNSLPPVGVRKKSHLILEAAGSAVVREVTPMPNCDSPASSTSTRERAGSLTPSFFKSRVTSAGNSPPAETRMRSYTNAHASVEVQQMLKAKYLSGVAVDRERYLTKSLERSRLRNRERNVPGSSSLDSLLNGQPEKTHNEVLFCLMPTGIVLDVKVHPDDIIYNIKKIVLNVATTSESLPMRGCLNPNWKRYSVFYVSQTGVGEEVFDETKTLRELKPFRNILKFFYRARISDNVDYKKFISKLIGKDLREYRAIQSCEVNDFRWKMKTFASNLVQERRRRLELSWQDRIRYQYPPRLIPSASRCLDFVQNNVVNKEERHFHISLVWNNVQEKVRVDYDTTADELVVILGEKLGFNSTRCCFKAVGENSYLFGSHKMLEFSFVYEHLRLGNVPQLVIAREDSVDVERMGENVYLYLEREVVSKYEVGETSQLLMAKSFPVFCSNEVKVPFSVFIDSVKLSSDYVPASTSSQYSSLLGIRLGVYHGSKSLCSTVAHHVKGQPLDNSIFEVQRSFQFDILVADLPRMAKLCIGIYEKRKNNTVHPLFWVNAHIFDYKSVIRWRDTLQMWKYSLGGIMPTHEGTLVPLQHSICNPDIKEASDIVVCFAPIPIENDVITTATPDSEGVYPMSPDSRSTLDFSVQQQRIEYASTVNDKETFSATEDSFSDGGSISSSWSSCSGMGGMASKLYAQELQKIAERDPLHDITVQEKDLIWKLREYCCFKLPHVLPRVVDCVDYSDCEQVRELHGLIARWPLLSVERALQLLDYAYPDQIVRRFAVTCLRTNADDSDVLMYLLQLVQALKHEAYLFSDLMEFLLERALCNQHVGHSLFWELRAEMNRSAVSLLYGLLMETYLVAAPEHTQLLGQQVTLLDKCKATALSISKLEAATKSYDRAKSCFASAVRNQFNGHHPYRNFVNPLNPNQMCERLRASKCRLMNSKMRPQMLVFKTAVSTGSQPSSLQHPAKDVFLMFKKGDDLRQDRLTLQLLSVMDRLWKGAGMDLRMKIYKCVATDRDEGLIDAVRDAETICKIQMSSSSAPTTAVFRKGMLLAWLRCRNGAGGIKAMARAQEQFTLSCAGYSVAAYVLGIGDRHNDNIMVRPNGQMFHIDFGHILGNFKHKFGIRRERVPMLLSSEFIDVIKTSEFGNVRNFERFRNLCERAYLTLRRHGCLLISLLAMMISTGLPELSSEQDLNIVRATLNLDRTEEEALETFKKEFDESLRNAWKISLDWWFHMMNQTRTSVAK